MPAQIPSEYGMGKNVATQDADYKLWTDTVLSSGCNGDHVSLSSTLFVLDYYLSLSRRLQTPNSPSLTSLFSLSLLLQHWMLAGLTSPTGGWYGGGALDSKYQLNKFTGRLS